MKKAITFLLILLYTSLSFAQQVRVSSKSDLQAVSNCSVYNAEKTVSVTTDNNGFADLSIFKTSDKLTFSHVSFIPVTFDKSFFTDKVTDISLTVAVINLQEVVLSANKSKKNTVIFLVF